MFYVELCTKSAKHKFSADILKYFLIFARKQDLTFHAKLSPNVILFSGKNKHIINILSESANHQFSADDILK